MNVFERKGEGRHAGDWEPMPESILRLALSHHSHNPDRAFEQLAAGKTIQTPYASYRQVGSKSTHNGSSS